MIGYALLLVILLMTAAGQVFFKHHHVSGNRPSLFLAVASFILVVPLTFVCVRMLGLATVYVFMALSYGLVAFLGYRLFGEVVTRRQVFGILVIMAGCSIYNL
jgi:drug/metabolite transporter (DMT)-like permease